ncbi:MAG: hypothetical protein KDC38_09705 [Planctomycetes bacterium]|nr:hypothetical protein [Planctomycetota bacterium]
MSLIVLVATCVTAAVFSDRQRLERNHSTLLRFAVSNGLNAVSAESDRVSRLQEEPLRTYAIESSPDQRAPRGRTSWKFIWYVGPSDASLSSASATVVLEFEERTRFHRFARPESEIVITGRFAELFRRAVEEALREKSLSEPEQVSIRVR